MKNNASTLSSRPDLVPAGAFSYPVNSPKPTRWFGFLILPEFTLLAFSAALDPLRIANQLAQKPLYGWSVLSEDGLAVSSSSGIDIGVHGAVSDVKVDNVANANDAIRRMDSAWTTVNSLRGDLGAIQNRFESTIANLSTSVENLSASNSRILDADFAAETANLAKSQVLQQAGISVLAQANARPQQVLSLLQ